MSPADLARLGRDALARYPRLCLVLLCLALFLPSFASLPVVDRDEGRFMQASRQMVQSGDWVDIRLQDVPRYKKPVGIYWAQSLTALANGGADASLWAFRLPSLLAAVLAVLCVHAVGRLFFAPRVAFTAAALVAACLVMAGEARLGKTDAALLATTVLAQWALARCYAAPSLRIAPAAWVSYVFWLALAASILVKGPLGVMVVGLTLLALGLTDRNVAWCRPLMRWQPLLLALVVVLPWFIAITLRSHGQFWSASVGEDMLAKVAAGQEGHGAPPGSLLLVSWLSFWPGSVLVALTLPLLWRLRDQPGARFALAWLLPTWLVFELVPTKLLHYVLPVFPALALLVAQAWWSTVARPGTLARVAAAGLLAIGPALLLAVLWLIGLPLQSAAWPAMVALPLATAAAVLAWLSLAQGRRAATVGWLLPLALCTYAGVLGSLQRHVPAWPSDGIVASLQEATRAGHACAAPALHSLGYHEPSLVWLTAGRIRRADDPGAAVQALQANACAVLVLEARQRDEFAAAASARGLLVRAVGGADGFAFGAGKWVSLALVVPVQQPPRQQRVE